jgi:hypothetical protein
MSCGGRKTEKAKIRRDNFPDVRFCGNDKGKVKTPALTNMCLYLRLIRQIKKEMSRKFVSEGSGRI